MNDRLREALVRAAEAMDIVRDGLAVHSTDAVVINAESILRHAAREARAALAEPEQPTSGEDYRIAEGDDEREIRGY